MRLHHRLLAICLLLSVSAVAWPQHDLHRNAARDIAAGGTELAKAVAVLNGNQDDVESLYLLAAAHCLTGDIDTALAFARRAVAAGLPIERLQAGPRQEFAPLYASDAYRKWAAGQERPLIHGPMLGQVTADSASVWVRTAKAAAVTVEVKASDEVVATASTRTGEEYDFTAVAKVTGLAASTDYSYRVLLDGKPVTEPATFRTTVEPGKPAKFRVAFGGGAGYAPESERMWDTITAHRPAAMLMLGDNVDIDDPTHLFTQLYCYYRRQSRPEWRRLVSTAAVYSIWHDHDFGTDDCVPGPDIDQPAWKRQVWRTFQNQWVNPAYGGGAALPGCWYDFHIGDVHFIMIDGRYYRDQKGGSMLGPRQKAWLKTALAASQATFKVIASDVPFTPGIKLGSRDAWDGYPAEREESFSFIESEKIDGVILIAADRHRSDVRKIEREDGYDFIEFQSSRLTNRHTHGVVKTPGLIFGYNKECSFGIIDFDTTREDFTAAMTIVNIDGEVMYSMELPLSKLSHINHGR